MKIIIAGGGTGGHIFPGIAIAEEFKRREDSSQILFIGTKRGIESRIIPNEGYEIRYISSEGLKGKGIFKRVKSICKIPVGIIQSIKILNSFMPDIVIGVGGYASGPVGAASLLLGYPLAIQEQNLFPGLTNRMLGRYADLIFTSFDETKKFFNGRKVCLTGNPIRKGIAECGMTSDDFELKFSTPNSTPHILKFTLLIIGGSQGAHSINMAMVDGLKYLSKFSDSIFIIHQTGKTDFEYVKKAYDEMGFESEVAPFIYNMADSYRRADLLICRAGATTISEITVCGKAAILIPFPFAIYNHQDMNASVLRDHGAAEMILEKELNGKVLANKIIFLMQNRANLFKMENESRKMGKAGAAKEIVEQCYRLLNNTFTAENAEAAENYKLKQV